MGDTDRTDNYRHSAYKKFWSSFFKSLKKEKEEEPPPILKSWTNLYLIVLGNLLFWIALFTIFTWMFQ